MIWVKFTSIESFNSWHNSIKALLELPKISTDFQGNPMPEATMTTNYVEPVIVAEDDVRAFIDEEYASDLSISESPFVSNYEQA